METPSQTKPPRARALSLNAVRDNNDNFSTFYVPRAAVQVLIFSKTCMELEPHFTCHGWKQLEHDRLTTFQMINSDDY